MDNKLVYKQTDIKHHHHHHHPPPPHHHLSEQEKLSRQADDENFSQSPKVTVSLPKHAASRLRDLVQRRDIALLRLGIISVQFEDDQSIPLILNNSNTTTTTTNSNRPNPQDEQPQESQPQLQHQQQQQQQQQPLAIPCAESIVETLDNIDNCNANCIGSLDTAITKTLTGLSSPNHQNPILEDDEDMETNLNTSNNSPIMQSPIVTTTTTTTTATTASQQTSNAKSDCNSNSNLAVVYVDEEDDDKDEDEVVSEVENQHSSFNIHQLSQLEFADPIELDMYDNDNLLFPDYTLNLS